MAHPALLRKDQADLILERAAMQLRGLLAEACRELDPFPSFPNAFFTNAIECEPGPGADPNVGCIVVCQDGELYELEFGVDQDTMDLTGLSDPVTARLESLKKVELHPRDYIVYAYSGLVAVTEHILEARESAKAGG